MKRLKLSIAAWSAVSAVASFWLLNMFIPYERMVEISSSLVLGVTFAVLVRWASDAARALRSGRDGPDFLIVAVFSIVLILFFQRVWVVAVRFYDRADHLVNSPISAFIAWMLAWACVLVLIAPDAENGNIPGRSRVFIGVALFIAGMVSGLGLALAIV
ncbi:UNVERIFIED_ORG: fucose 4-O-acetylase-like acetyltransferase [Rhizobium sophorae]|uniref:hypothetical protein n=1 Tax=Rhizobium leguminosarum TaxID=384 RepID=UPI00160E70F4|nr:hypothetical protein [Rhizobium leguminosarum]MBB4520460.1 fucose 4-O-acetylase-like acetyltransferase [Rhizobium leguminosarum]MDH6658341.1 fucose 4-O-acetylase-like acetyltransferase [Rhizobium sophorae]